MAQHIAHISLVVNDYDEAIEFYTKKLGFELLEDTPIEDNKRWVMIAPKGAKECCLLLARAATPQQKTRVGNQTGGRVGFFLFTDDIERDRANLLANQITIVRPLTHFEYGNVIVFADLYGNLWDLIQPSKRNKGLDKSF